MSQSIVAGSRVCARMAVDAEVFKVLSLSPDGYSAELSLDGNDEVVLVHSVCYLHFATPAQLACYCEQS